ncbi:MAG: metallophosphoesterase [Candidatus Kapaibacterium sp.]|nr:MAG: metallophosphoesterase [Candidatus Kapabacteria bacterium]
MPFPFRLLFLCGVIIFLDWYFFHAVQMFMRTSTPAKRTIVSMVYWGITLASLSAILFSLFVPLHHLPHFVRVYIFSFFIIIGISKLIGSVFLLVDDGMRLASWLWLKGASMLASWQGSRNGLASDAVSFPRKQFLSNLALIGAALPFSAFIYGMVRGAYNYTVHKVSVNLPNLPKEFNGFKIVHISDIHIGSFQNSAPLEKAFALINAQKPDIIFFTGDLVNNRADEAAPHIETLKKLRAEYGVFSTIGNHDYGDYVKWDSTEAKRENFEQLQQVHTKAGWTLLMNEHRVLERGAAKLAVIGIENWGAAMNFPKRGDLKRAASGTESTPVRLLLSHDPSHWDAQVRKEFGDIDVTFSGHTHGAQFGIEIPGFRWSPVQYFYKQWAGLYRDGTQYLYVNRGLGFLGYPGRVGISPEITVMELRTA